MVTTVAAAARGRAGPGYRPVFQVLAVPLAGSGGRLDQQPSAAAAPELPANPLDVLPGIIAFIFSWVVLLPISLIVSGKLFAPRLKLRVTSRAFLTIHVPPSFRIEATGDEVFSGFAAFIPTFLIIGLVFGRSASDYFRTQYGIDPGQFNTLEILSSFVTLVWTLILHMISRADASARDPVAAERDAQIAELLNRRATPPGLTAPQPPPGPPVEVGAVHDGGASRAQPAAPEAEHGDGN